MKSRLVIDGQDVAFNQALPISTNLSVSDIREPGKSKGHYTKTITIPGTPQANQLFEYAFDCNIESDVFNANLALDAIYYVNEVKVYEGKLQLLQINKRYDGEVWGVEYECSIVGEVGNIFLEVGQRFLTDIDFSDLDHPLTYASGLFNPTLGEGYCYPYIDYGLYYSGVRCGYDWTFEHLKPAIFERDYVMRIFEDAGCTIEPGGYFDSTYAKSIIIPCVSAGALQLPNATIVDNQFLAGMTSPVSANMTQASAGLLWTFNSYSVGPVEFDSTASPGFDPGNVYDSVTNFRFAPGISATYTMTAKIGGTITVNHPASTVTVAGTILTTIVIYKSTNGGGSWSATPAASSVTTNINGGAPASTQIEVVCTLPPTLVTLPALYRVHLSVVANNFSFLDVSNNPCL